MEKFIINPENYQLEYIHNLNECFRGWGGEKEYQWALDRTVGDKTADIMLIENEEDGVIAGSAISYRKLSKGDESFEIGIMTGSWTLPAARRKGCFGKIIECSKKLCKEKNVAFLTAFVTETNASCRRLESAGSFMFPTYHLFSPEVPFQKESLVKAEIIENDEETYRSVFNVMQQRQADFLNFSYDYSEFVTQYLDRIKKTTILKINDDFAVLEDGLNEIKVLLLTYQNTDSFKINIKAVTDWCLENKSKKAFFFTTRRELYDSCTALGFENLPGYFTILNTSGMDVSYEKDFDFLNINMADKM